MAKKAKVVPPSWTHTSIRPSRCAAGNKEKVLANWCWYSPFSPKNVISCATSLVLILRMACSYSTRLKPIRNLKLLKKKIMSILVASETDTDFETVAAAVKTVYGGKFEKEELKALLQGFNQRAVDLLAPAWKSFFNEQCLLVRLSYHAGTRLCNFLLQTTKMVLPVVHGTRQIVKRTTFLPAYFKVVRIPKLTLYTFRSYFRVFAVIVRLSYHAWTRMCNFYHKHQRWYFQL